MKNFNIRLKALRKEKRRTQDDVAKHLNIKRATYSGYERGVIMPPYEKIDILAKYFGVSVDYLMGEHIIKEETDALKTISGLLRELRDEHSGVIIDGVELDKESREFLISSLESSLKMSKHIAKNNKKGQ